MAVDEQVLGLEVSVQDPMRVAEGDSLDHLVQVRLERWGRKQKEREKYIE